MTTPPTKGGGNLPASVPHIEAGRYMVVFDGERRDVLRDGARWLPLTPDTLVWALIDKILEVRGE